MCIWGDSNGIVEMSKLWSRRLSGDIHKTILIVALFCFVFLFILFYFVLFSIQFVYWTNLHKIAIRHLKENGGKLD